MNPHKIWIQVIIENEKYSNINYEVESLFFDIFTFIFLSLITFRRSNILFWILHNLLKNFQKFSSFCSINNPMINRKINIHNLTNSNRIIILYNRNPFNGIDNGNKRALHEPRHWSIGIFKTKLTHRRHTTRPKLPPLERKRRNTQSQLGSNKRHKSNGDGDDKRRKHTDTSRPLPMLLPSLSTFHTHSFLLHKPGNFLHTFPIHIPNQHKCHILPITNIHRARNITSFMG